MRESPIIIGAGPAGCAAAIGLAHAGLRPMLLERSAAVGDKVCGDFLSVDTMQQAVALGVDPMALGAAPIERVRLVHRGRSAEVALPFAACGLTRRRLDGALLARAQQAGAELTAGVAVREVKPDGQGWQVMASNVSVRSGTVMVATGKHDLRGWPRKGRIGGAIGLKMYYSPRAGTARHLDGHIELMLFPGGYAGMQFVEDGMVVLCLAIRPAALRVAGGWDGVLRHLGAANKRLGALLADAACVLPRVLAIAAVPYGFRAEGTLPGLFRVGDQAAVIPSLTGDGISIALHTGTWAAEALQSGLPAPAWQDRTAQALGGQMRLAGVIHAAALHEAVQSVLVPLAEALPNAVAFAARRTRVGCAIGFHERAWCRRIHSTP